MRCKISFLMLALVASVLTLSAQTSKIVYPDQNGILVYKAYTDKGDIIPDFSFCGYGGGGVETPTIAVVETVTPTNGSADDAPRIQAAIDKVAQMPLKNGFRGAVLLKKGKYNIASTIKIPASGIILCGEGNSERGTFLYASEPKKYVIIQVGAPSRYKADEGSRRKVTDEYVPSGTKVLTLESTDGYKVGDEIVVHRPSTAKWINVIGMDSIPPRPQQGKTTIESFQQLRKEGYAMNMNGTTQWKEGSKDLLFERTITAVNGNKITLDIPIANALQKEFGAAQVYKFSIDRIENCGVENLFSSSYYDPKVTAQNEHIGTYAADEKHSSHCISVGSAKNCWVRNVAVKSYDCAVSTSPTTIYFTGADLSATEPISVITGGRRSPYSVSGQMNLFIRCYGSHHRHVFVQGASVAGPNAFVDGIGEMCFASSEPHQRWATGCLYDNITLTGPEASFTATNRGWMGSGHGWSGAQMVYWNCSAPLLYVLQPPTAQNFVIGTDGFIDDKWSANRESSIKSFNGVSMNNYEFKGVQPIGNGWFESVSETVAPKSLYFTQLKERLGIEAVKKIATPKQINTFIDK